MQLSLLWERWPQRCLLFFRTKLSSRQQRKTQRSLNMTLVTAMLPSEPTMVAALVLEAMILDTTEVLSVLATTMALLAVTKIVAQQVEATTVAMVLLAVTTASMVNLQAIIVASTVVIADLVATTELLLLVDTTEYIAHLEMTNSGKVILFISHPKRFRNCASRQSKFLCNVKDLSSGVY